MLPLQTGKTASFQFVPGQISAQSKKGEQHWSLDAKQLIWPKKCFLIMSVPQEGSLLACGETVLMQTASTVVQNALSSENGVQI